MGKLHFMGTSSMVMASFGHGRGTTDKNFIHQFLGSSGGRDLIQKASAAGSWRIARAMAHPLMLEPPDSWTWEIVAAFHAFQLSQPLFSCGNVG